MAWVEIFLNFTNGYYKVASNEGDQFEYLVPFPPKYTSTMKAYWTTDVIVLDPSCSWQNATTTETFISVWDVTLPKSNLSISLRNESFGMVLLSSNFFMCLLNSVSSPANMTRVSVYVCDNTSSEFTVPVDGSVLFVIDQLDYPESQLADSISMDLSSIPTLKFPTGNVLAFLLCSPHVSIQTRQVWATGNGNLTLGKPQQSQGNIDFYQANYLLSYILLEFSTSSGPTTYPGQMGTDLMEWLIFGNGMQSALHGDTNVYEPASLANITAVYKRVISSAMKTLLSGAIASENVPGGYTKEQMVFTSSLGHVFTSAILFAFLTITLVVAQFRKRRVAFTFVNVAAALAHSDAPQKCEEMTQFMTGTGERKTLKLVPNGDGQLNCAYQSIDPANDFSGLQINFRHM